MVKGHYNEVYTYKFLNYINVNNSKKVMEMFEVKCNYQNRI